MFINLCNITNKHTCGDALKGMNNSMLLDSIVFLFFTIISVSFVFTRIFRDFQGSNHSEWSGVDCILINLLKIDAVAVFCEHKLGVRSFYSKYNRMSHIIERDDWGQGTLCLEVTLLEVISELVDWALRDNSSQVN